jgi:ribosomal protein S18 acetylase RimI-like enzyme
MIRPAEMNDVSAIKTIAVDTKMFDADSADFVDDVVAGILDGTLHDHRFVVCERSAGSVIAVHPSQQGNGIGSTLIDHVERHLQQAGPDSAQVLIVETSSTDQYARTREFYPKQGYVEEARIRRFYGPDDDKVVYWKALTA